VAIGKKKAKKWSLPRSSVFLSWQHSSSTTAQGNYSRKLKRTKRKVTLSHPETGLSVIGEIGPGSYSKKEMRAETVALEKKLFSELEKKVAKALKVPGRSGGR